MLPAKTRTQVANKQSAFSRAMERFAARRHAKRIGFVVDATGSRSHTWEQAQTIQAKMFRSVARLGTLSLRLVHFGGYTLTDHGWESDPRAVAARMAQVRCERGLTKILPALTALLDDPADRRASAIILIGDSFEESYLQVAPLAEALKAAGIKVFSFFEGENTTGEDVFRELADATGGVFARFGAELPLSDLCEGVALLTAGGEKAAGQLKNKAVRRLLLTGPAKK
jgi:hypothetical protein